jgi:hypothetical protein
VTLHVATNKISDAIGAALDALDLRDTLRRLMRRSAAA